MEIIRATETYQQAGAYYVRIQAMAKKHHITLRAEFDEHDGPDTRYIVLLDDGFPVATSRLYPIDQERAMIGRVVVLPEYRNKGLGSLVMAETEKWAKELGHKITVVESRDNKVEFYEKLGYVKRDEAIINHGTFDCITMEKTII